MSVVPGSIDTSQQPPMTVPLRHFVVAFGFLFAGVVLGVGVVTGLVGGLARVAHIHLLLVGWICLTIMGAMTQFVPVWSGVEIHSRRLASAQLWLVTVGLVGFAAGLVSVSLGWLILFGSIMLIGFWTFVYNIARTLVRVDELDVTERHFALALGYFVLLTTFGILLAIDFTIPLFDDVPVSHANLLGAHATLAVFGAVLTTVFGALYQLATMFTQTELDDIDVQLRRVEEIGYTVGVLTLTGGRLFAIEPLARIGGILVVLSVLAFSIVLGRLLARTQVPWTPMLSRYTVVVGAMAGWALLTIPHWLWNATGATVRFGAPGAGHLLALGGIGFVVLGTVYHVIPFIIWVHRYSDLLGFEDVPMIDDLYDDRLAAADFTLFVGGTILIVGTALFDRPDYVTAIGGVVVTAGVVLFTANMLLVIRRHSPQSLTAILLSRAGTGSSDKASEEKPA